jgi:molecular chaperone GrpE
VTHEGERLEDQAVPEADFDEEAAAPEPSGAAAGPDEQQAPGERAGPDAGAPQDEREERGEEIDLATVIAQRDEYLALARRVQADFENFRKRALKQQQDHTVAATGRLVESLLPVLDAFDQAVIHGAEEVAPLHRQLLDVLGKQGLEVIPTEGVAFDPNLHEAVVHEPGDETEPQIVECLRTGYTWQGRTLRAAMVKVKG